MYRRSASGVVVTPVGAELARRFALAMSEIDSARDEIGISITQRPAIRIGVLPLTPRRFLSAATELALRQDTQRRIEIVEGSYPVLSQQVQDGRLNILFGALPPGKSGESLVKQLLVFRIFYRHHMSVRSRSSSSLAAALPWRILSRVLFIRPKLVMLPEAIASSMASTAPPIAKPIVCL